MKEEEEKKKDPSQTPHTLVIDTGWLKLQTQLWLSAGSHACHLLCLPV